MQNNNYEYYAFLFITKRFVCVNRSKDYQKLADSRKYSMKYRDAVASLAVHDVVDKDKGLYTCEASNVHGYATSAAALRIKGESTIRCVYLLLCVLLYNDL